MATLKLFIQNNFLFAIPSDRNIVGEGLAKDVRCNKLLNTIGEEEIQKYSFTNLNNIGETFPFRDAPDGDVLFLDETDTPFADEAAFEEWYTAELGKYSGGDTPSTTSIVAYAEGITATEGQNQFIVPPNTVVTSVYNLSITDMENPSLSWSQAGAGEVVFMNSLASEGDVFIFSGWTYADVSPPTYKEYEALLNQSTSSQSTGDLIVGHEYLISVYNATDDFANVGASANEQGISFTATGTTPTEWIASSVLVDKGLSAPVATVLENTLGGTVVWSYVGAGNYLATLASAFTENKTVLYGQANNGPTILAALNLSDANSFAITTFEEGTQSDGWLLNSPITVRVYT